MNTKFLIKERLKNPIFWVNTIIGLITPIMIYYSTQVSDLTTWSSVKELFQNAISNPYVLILSLLGLWNSFYNPTTKGIGDILNIDKKEG